MRPHQVRLGAQGAYPATVLKRGEVEDGQRRVVVRLGDATLAVLADPDCPPEGPCRAHIDPQALQVWPWPQPPGMGTAAESPRTYSACSFTGKVL